MATVINFTDFFFVLSFVPYQGVVQKIVESFAGKYPHPWSTRGEVPESQRDIWFNEFKVNYLYNEFESRHWIF